MFKRSPKAAWQQLDGHVVVVTPENKLIHILSGTGLDIWTALDRPQTFHDLLSGLLDQYDVALDQLKCDVEAFCTELLEKGVIVCAFSDVDNSK